MSEFGDLADDDYRSLQMPNSDDNDSDDNKQKPDDTTEDTQSNDKNLVDKNLVDLRNSKPEDNDNGQNTVASDSVQIYTMREYRKLFAKRIPGYGTQFIRSSMPPMYYVKPRVMVPASGQPAIFVAEGVQCQTKELRLLSPGITLQFTGCNSFEYAVLGLIWVCSLYLNHL